ncbi:MAG TPA: hypothetical protein VI541_05580 [Actinomycetota bacterium]|nr:hypothetical protein [Actinomycetota bacterium]
MRSSPGRAILSALSVIFTLSACSTSPAPRELAKVSKPNATVHATSDAAMRNDVEEADSEMVDIAREMSSAGAGLDGPDESDLP